ncbi:NADPH-dependent 7-cyano-7-deazaguanine reductase QueF [Sessilibacter sp. MAH4]
MSDKKTVNNAHGSLLGKETKYVSKYDKSLLFPIARKTARSTHSLNMNVAKLQGFDLWTAWEISWLNPKGLPQVAVAEFRFPLSCESIVESKSFKLYLNSFNQTRFESIRTVRECMQTDLSLVTGGSVDVRLMTLKEAETYFQASSGSLAPFDIPSFLTAAHHQNKAICLDQQDIQISGNPSDKSILTLDLNRKGRISEVVYSDLLKTNCPVTGQPDWASLWIYYKGVAISHENLLRYVVGMREHQDFHEQCVERIFYDISAQCGPEQLLVYARYTRRGGLDINPLRTNIPLEQLTLNTVKLIRQ